ncbi:MAG: GDSL-type esterase/lipase family protein [Myxococcaceae bacterium]|nr:GDSL-type esterase/lipase family protein [Myxococcaceae bacterium]
MRRQRLSLRLLGVVALAACAGTLSSGQGDGDSLVCGVGGADVSDVDAGDPEDGGADAGDPDGGSEDAGDSEDGGHDAGDPDGGGVDAGEPEDGGVDAGEPEDGGVDAGDSDGGDIDAGDPDGGGVDAGEPEDGGVDAGHPDGGSEDDGGVDGGPGPSSCLKIMPLGDSNTVGVDGGYRDGLFARLTEVGCAVDFVGSQYDESTDVEDKDHEGHSGFNIGSIRVGIDGWLAANPPDYLLVMAGTNDVAWECGRPVQEIAAEHAELVDRIQTQRPGVWVVVASIPPLSSQVIGPCNVDRAQLAQELNLALRADVESRQESGQRVKFADVFSALTVSDLTDGVHPSEEAHEKVAETWFRALQTITTCAPTSTCGQ